MDMDVMYCFICSTNLLSYFFDSGKYSIKLFSPSIHLHSNTTNNDTNAGLLIIFGLPNAVIMVILMFGNTYLCMKKNLEININNIIHTKIGHLNTIDHICNSSLKEQLILCELTIGD